MALGTVFHSTSLIPFRLAHLSADRLVAVSAIKTLLGLHLGPVDDKAVLFDLPQGPRAAIRTASRPRPGPRVPRWARGTGRCSGPATSRPPVRGTVEGEPPSRGE
ncbi:MAG TPA: hypothetical protein DGR79_03350 [Clostridiales bacterium]|nr:hypothetical protein [Clostridiales bacterium]